MHTIAAQYADAGAYTTKFRQLQGRALGAVRNMVQQVLKTATQQVRNKVQQVLKTATQQVQRGAGPRNLLGCQEGA